MFALAARAALPERYRAPAVPIVALFAAFGFFIPLFGMLGPAAALAAMLLVPSSRRWHPFVGVRTPEYVSPQHESAHRLRIAGLQTTLLDVTLPAEVRARSLVTLQNMPPRVSDPVLRKLLSDPSDDLRLEAYEMIDAREKSITGRIGEELEALERSENPAARLYSLRLLAEQHWELVYAELVQGDLREHAIAEGLRHVEEALALAGEEAGLWFLKGRLLQAAGRHAEAAEAYSIAISSGLPESRALPYLAEIAYERRDFPLLRQYMGVIAETQRTPAMAAVIRFWTGAEARA
jgi:tetratricopeptide (TPR) repeat protein